MPSGEGGAASQRPPGPRPPHLSACQVLGALVQLKARDCHKRSRALIAAGLILTALATTPDKEEPVEHVENLVRWYTQHERRPARGTGRSPSTPSGSRVESIKGLGTFVRRDKS